MKKGNKEIGRLIIDFSVSDKNTINKLAASRGVTIKRLVSTAISQQYNVALGGDSRFEYYCGFCHTRWEDPSSSVTHCPQCGSDDVFKKIAE